MHVHLDELRQPILVQVQNEVVNKVESVADNDEWKLIRQLGLLKEVLDLLRVVIVALSTDTFYFSYLTSAACCLNVLEVYFGILAEIDNGAEIVVETCE